VYRVSLTQAESRRTIGQRGAHHVPHGPGANPSSVFAFDLYWPVRVVPER
jgi:hypothetical protein